ncbi:BLOC1S4 [Acanthosepion pharaonis]|uniref:BLOC1S4 n=1 Tax=Acanthosepion pharaonis TaxID=158019 RepID=A0A812DDS1_ACAPH|nr:BLOC1S4 [Sepia pharaonis]
MSAEADDMEIPVVVSDLPSTVLTEELISDYVEYLKVDSSQEEKRFSESIDEMLTKLDEFCGLVDMIRGDSTLCLYKTLPEISMKAAEMQKVFDKIDQLEAFVSIVSKNVHMMEEHVNKAEAKMGSLSGIKKMITSLVSPKHSAARSRTNSRTDNFQPPEIFSTSEYFPKQP